MSKVFIPLTLAVILTVGTGRSGIAQDGGLSVTPEQLVLNDGTPTTSFTLTNTSAQEREVWLDPACETSGDSTEYIDLIIPWRNQSSCAGPWLSGYHQHVLLAPQEQRTLSLTVVPYPTLADGHYTARIIWATNYEGVYQGTTVRGINHGEIHVSYDKGPQSPRRTRTHWRAMLPVERTAVLVSHTPAVLVLNGDRRAATFTLRNPGAKPTEVWLTMDCPWFRVNLVDSPKSHAYEASWHRQIPSAVFWLSGYPQHVVLAPHEQRTISLQANPITLVEPEEGQSSYAQLFYVQSPLLTVTRDGDTTYTTPAGTIDVVYRWGTTAVPLTLSQLHRTQEPDGRAKACVTVQQPGIGAVAVLHAEIEDTRGRPVRTRSLAGSGQGGHPLPWTVDTTVAVWEVVHGARLQPNYIAAEPLSPDPVCFTLPALASGHYQFVVSAFALEDTAKRRPVRATLPL